jgi:hypothetical protein
MQKRMEGKRGIGEKAADVERRKRNETNGM